MTSLESLPTPALLLDLGRARRNARRIGERVRALGARLRPHVKTHKCLEVARLQVAGGFGGITVSTLAEASAFAAGGFTDITYAVPIESGKFAAAAAIARGGTRLAVITDDPAIPRPLGEAARTAGVVFDTFIEVDCGDHRTGIDPESPLLAELAERIGERGNLRFAGILTHAGHSYLARNVGEVREVAAQERDVMRAAAARLAEAGSAAPVISVGSTPTITHVDHLEGIHEVRAGNYIFHDVTQVALGTCTLDDCALSVLAAVVQRSTAQRHVVLDVGAIALSKDRGPTGLDLAAGYGRVCTLDGTDVGLRVASVSQEHGVVPVADPAQLEGLAVGTRVRVMVNHSCLTAAQHAEYAVHEGTHVVDRWAIRRGW